MDKRSGRKNVKKKLAFKGKELEKYFSVFYELIVYLSLY